MEGTVDLPHALRLLHSEKIENIAVGLGLSLLEFPTVAVDQGRKQEQVNGLAGGPFLLPGAEAFPAERTGRQVLDTNLHKPMGRYISLGISAEDLNGEVELGQRYLLVRAASPEA